MEGIILYQSKYGATRKYAEWLSEETGFAICETLKAKIEDIQRYDAVLLGGGIYASGIAGLSFLSKHINALQDKKLIVFCDGASPYNEQAFSELVRRNLKGALESIPCFYCRGTWDMNAMSFMDRALCKMLKKSLAKKKPGEYLPWEEALMAAGDGPCDWTDQKYIAPILAELAKQP